MGSIGIEPDRQNTSAEMTENVVGKCDQRGRGSFRRLSKSEDFDDTQRLRVGCKTKWSEKKKNIFIYNT